MNEQESEEYLKKKDEEFHTCRTCGIKDGEEKYNWVLLNQCRKCRTKEENERDFKEAKEKGEITRDDTIMCCNCCYVQDDECYDWNDSDEWTCPECSKVHRLKVDFTTHYTTYIEVEK